MISVAPSAKPSQSIINSAAVVPFAILSPYATDPLILSRSRTAEDAQDTVPVTLTLVGLKPVAHEFPTLVLRYISAGGPDSTHLEPSHQALDRFCQYVLSNTEIHSGSGASGSDVLGTITVSYTHLTLPTN